MDALVVGSSCKYLETNKKLMNKACYGGLALQTKEPADKWTKNDSLN